MKYVNEQGVAFGLLSKEDQEYIKAHPEAELFGCDGEWQRAIIGFNWLNERVYRAPVPVEKIYRPLTADEYHFEPIRSRPKAKAKWRPYVADPNGIECHKLRNLTWQELADNWEYYKDQTWQRMRKET